MLDFHLLSLSHILDFSVIPHLLAQSSLDFRREDADPVFLVIRLIFSLLSYLVFSYLSWEIFKKINVENAWFAWVPILGFYIALVAGDNDNPVLWTVLIFVPCVNLVAIFIYIGAWIRICQKLGKSPWLLLLCLLPCINFLVFGYLAFG